MDREATLRERLISHLERTGVLRLRRAASAMRVVPRHRFIPSDTLEDAYADRAVAIKMNGDEIVSSISQPGMIAQMLELLEPLCEEHVLEIGTGSGYNAALLAEMVGPNGSVTTIDVDGDLVERARDLLQELGYTNVRAVAADGTADSPAPREYDRVIVTARSDDVADAWWQSLREGARLVVPLRLEGVGEYAVGFDRHSDRLESTGAYPCAFIALRRDDAAIPTAVFYRDSVQYSGGACVRPIGAVTAVRRSDAAPQLLNEADIVIARPITVFAVRFA